MSTSKPIKARPYSDFLTPSLHRRFTGAAAGSLLVSYVVAVWLAGPTSFWSWFPVGPATIRTLLVFVCSLVVYFLRLGHIHVGSLTTSSSFQTLSHLALGTIPIQICFWYAISAMVFFVVYLTSASESADIQVIAHGRPHERQRLNERPVFLASLFLWAAIVQGIFHVVQHIDQLHLPNGTSSPPTKPLLVQLRQRLLRIADATFKRALIITISGTVLYFVLFRGIALNIQHSVVGYFYTVTRAKTFGIPGLPGLILQFFIACIFLLFIWESANALFSVFLAQSPLKQGQPLTNFSNDPNGSLISGLRRPKEFSRNMAFWELSLISRNFELRRQTIYAEFQRADRAGGSTWATVSKLCLDEIRGVTMRIVEQTNPSPVTSTQPSQEVPAESLPKIAQPLLKDNIWQKNPPPNTIVDGAADALGNLAKAFGNSPGAPDPVTPRAKKLLEQGVDRLLTPEQRAKLKPAAIETQASGLVADFLRLPHAGSFFRQTFLRHVTFIICGSPYSKSGTIVSAVEALTQLCLHSLKEDKHGLVQGNILEIIRCFATTIKTIEGYLKTARPHWTDVEFNEAQRQASGEVEQVVHAVKAGLGQLLLTFGEYMDYLGASKDEVKEAKGLAREWLQQQEDSQRQQRIQTTGQPTAATG